MKANLAELKEARARKVEELDKLLDGFRESPETYEGEAKKSADAMQGAVDELTSKIAVEEKRLDLLAKQADRKAADARRGSPEKQLTGQFNFLRFIRSQLPNQPAMDGAELEAHQQAQAEFKAMGQNLGQEIGIPSFMMAVEKDIIVGTDTAGGHAVQTDVREIIPFLRVALRLEGLGATVLRGLNGPQKFPRRDNSPASGWVPEQGTSSEISPTLTHLTMNAKRNSCWLEYSLTSVLQMNTDVERMARDELSFQVRKSVDVAGFQGSGASNQPTGLLNTSGIGDVSHGTNGGAPTWANTLTFMRTLAEANVDSEAMKWAMTPGVLATMMGTEKSSSTARYILEEPGNRLLGHPVVWTNNVPSNLTKGTGTGLHAAILGHWPDLLIGQWGGISLLVDPFTRAKDGTVQIIVNSFWDIGVRQPGAFVAGQDIVVT